MSVCVCLSRSCLRGQRRVGLTAAVADGGGLQHVAEVVDLQRQRVADARVGRVALVVDS